MAGQSTWQRLSSWMLYLRTTFLTSAAVEGCPEGQRAARRVSGAGRGAEGDGDTGWGRRGRGRWRAGRKSHEVGGEVAAWKSVEEGGGGAPSIFHSDLLSLRILR